MLEPTVTNWLLEPASSVNEVGDDDTGGGSGSSQSPKMIHRSTDAVPALAPHRRRQSGVAGLSVKTTLHSRRAATRDGVMARMPAYYFRISNGPYSGASDRVELADQNAAWDEMTKVCTDLVGSISSNMKQNTEWSMELLDEGQKPIFRIRLVAETLK
jgi:hypothetical protein